MFLSELLEGLEYSTSGVEAEDTKISIPVTDSREAVKDCLFICLDGTRYSGESFAPEAVQRGAAACVAKSPIDGILTVCVADTRFAAAVIWNNYYSRPARDMRIFGITGTNGKTSTAVFLESILKADGRKTGIIGTLGCSSEGKVIECRGAEVSDIPAAMTTPDPKYLYGVLFEMRKMGVTDVVMEVSSHSLLQKKVAPLEFEVGIFTNLSPEHLDCHGDMETYFKVKSTLFCKCRKAVFNGDDEYGKRLCGRHVSASLAKDVNTENGCRYTLDIDKKSIPVHTSVRGAFTLYNTMLAAAAAIDAGVGDDAVTRGIAAVNNVCGRMERIVKSEEYGFDVFIDYAHTPRAIEAVLSGFAGRRGRLVALFGCGGDRDREKRPLMGKAAVRFADRVIITSDNPRSEDTFAIIKDITDGLTPEDMGRCTVIPLRRDAVRYAVKTAVTGDIIVLLGKGHETWETVKNTKAYFSERDIVAEALKGI